MPPTTQFDEKALEMLEIEGWATLWIHKEKCYPYRTLVTVLMSPFSSSKTFLEERYLGNNNIYLEGDL